MLALGREGGPGMPAVRVAEEGADGGVMALGESLGAVEAGARLLVEGGVVGGLHLDPPLVVGRELLPE